MGFQAEIQKESKIVQFFFNRTFCTNIAKYIRFCSARAIKFKNFLYFIIFNMKRFLKQFIANKNTKKTHFEDRKVKFFDVCFPHFSLFFGILYAPAQKWFMIDPKCYTFLES